MGKKLYVGNLSYSVTNSELEELFSRFGNVESAEVISDLCHGTEQRLWLCGDEHGAGGPGSD